MVCMRESWFFIYLSMFLSKSVILFLIEDSGRRIVELGWESFVDNSKSWVDDWENCYGNWRSWVDDWKNYYHDGVASMI